MCEFVSENYLKVVEMFHVMLGFFNAWKIALFVIITKLVSCILHYSEIFHFFAVHF